MPEKLLQVIRNGMRATLLFEASGLFGLGCFKIEDVQ